VGGVDFSTLSDVKSEDPPLFFILSRDYKVYRNIICKLFSSLCPLILKHEIDIMELSIEHSFKVMIQVLLT
jgi:hypothetical protein